MVRENFNWEQTMKYLLAFFSLVTVTYAEPAWIMTKYSGLCAYSVDFNCHQGEVLEGKIVRSGFFTPRYSYDLYSPEGVFLARAISRAFSCGFFCTSLMEFDIYDEMGDHVGYIGGQCCTTEPAKFVFMNESGIEVGSALLRSDSEKATFLILSPANTIVATLDGILSGNFSAWELHVKQSVGIDARTLKIFGAFVSDFHKSFIRTPVEHHYHQRNQ